MELQSVNPDDFTSAAQNRLDATLLVKFYLESKQDKARSVQEGRAVFRDVEFIDIRTPGSKDSVARPARPQDIARFPRHYEAFKKRIEMPVEGTPLAEWPIVTRSMADELAFYGIKTVEALANVSDSNLANFRGLGSFKRKAQEWLELAENDAPLEKLHAELAERDMKIAAQQSTIDDLSKRLDELAKRMDAPPADIAPVATAPVAVQESAPEPIQSEVVKKRRGRPRKNPLPE